MSTVTIWHSHSKEHDTSLSLLRSMADLSGNVVRIGMEMQTANDTAAETYKISLSKDQPELPCYAWIYRATHSDINQCIAQAKDRQKAGYTYVGVLDIPSPALSAVCHMLFSEDGIVRTFTREVDIYAYLMDEIERGS